MTRPAKRTELKAKIAKAQERQASRGAFSPARIVTDYTQEHPFAAMAGGAALGVLIALSLPVRAGSNAGSGKLNGKVRQAGKAALGLGLNIVENTGQMRRKSRKADDTSRSGLLDDLVILATNEVTKAIRKRM